MWEAIIDAWVYEAQMAHEAAVQARAARIAWMVCGAGAVITMGVNAAIATTVEVRKRGFLATVALFALANMALATLGPTAQYIYIANAAVAVGSLCFVYHENCLQGLKTASKADGKPEEGDSAPSSEPTTTDKTTPQQPTRQ